MSQAPDSRPVAESVIWSMAHRYADLFEWGIDNSCVAREGYYVPALLPVVATQIKGVALASAPHVGGDEVYQ